MKAEKIRLDELLVRRGLVASRQKARALILAGQVIVDGQPVDKPGKQIPVSSSVEIKDLPKYVGRGGDKLEAALKEFGVDVRGKVCLDVGASTGGFTDCLLQHGASRVYAVDVGRGQLHWKLRNDPRVVVKEGINARYLKPEDIGEPVDLVTCDVSFISSTLILPAVIPLLKPEGELLVLVKPQFEVGKSQVGKGGIVRDPKLHKLAIDKVAKFLEDSGFAVTVMSKPVLGTEGNQEFWLYGRRQDSWTHV